MAFKQNDMTLQGVDGGEVWTTSPYGATNYMNFQDGLEVGRIAQIKAGTLSNLDGTVTPDLAGVTVRRVSTPLENGTQVKTSNCVDVDVADFGRVSVYVVDGVTPVVGGAVYILNDASNDAGKATTDNTKLALPNAVFYKEVKSGVWVITLKQYMK